VGDLGHVEGGGPCGRLDAGKGEGVRWDVTHNAPVPGKDMCVVQGVYVCGVQGAQGKGKEEGKGQGEGEGEGEGKGEGKRVGRRGGQKGRAKGRTKGKGEGVDRTAGGARALCCKQTKEGGCSKTWRPHMLKPEVVLVKWAPSQFLNTMTAQERGQGEMAGGVAYFQDPTASACTASTAATSHATRAKRPTPSHLQARRHRTRGPADPDR
jgi:hypothetical protein